MSTGTRTKKRILVLVAVAQTLAILALLSSGKSTQRSRHEMVDGSPTPRAASENPRKLDPRSTARTKKSKRFSATRKVSRRSAMSITALLRGLQLSEEIVETLQHSPLEVEEVEAVLKASFEQTRKIEASLVEVGVDDDGYTTWTVPPYVEESIRVRDAMTDSLVSILGEERGEFMSIAASRNTGYFFKRGKGELTIRFVDSSLNGPSLAIQLMGIGEEVEARSFEQAPEQPGQLNKIRSQYGHLIGDFDIVYKNLAKLKSVSTWTYPEEE